MFKLILDFTPQRSQKTLVVEPKHACNMLFGNILKNNNILRKSNPKNVWPCQNYCWVNAKFVDHILKIVNQLVTHLQGIKSNEVKMS